MVKKKRAGATKRAGTRKKAPVRRKAAVKRAVAAPAALKLRDLRPLVEKSLRNIDTAATYAPGRYSDTRARLQRWMDDMDWLCNEDNPDGCGPHMAFPLPSA